MPIRRSIPFLLALFTFLAAGPTSGSGLEAERTILQPPEHGMYHAVFPDFGGRRASSRRYYRGEVAHPFYVTEPTFGPSL